MGIQNFSLRSVGSFLQEHVYYIPDYQREYSWEVDTEIDDFWMDLETLVNDKREQHFFGQVVIHNSKEENNRKYIIDGQQRTSTSVIFLSVLNKMFDELYSEYDHKGARNRTEDIRTKYIGRWEEDENELRLHLGKTDREYFMKNVQVAAPEEEKSPLKSHNRISKAYKFFRKKLSDMLENYGTADAKYNELYKYYTKFIDGFTVMYVETDDINEAFIIFETLNARGKDLETSDLLKNHLFRTSDKGIDKVKNDWQMMIDNLDKIDATRYIRHYWNSRDVFTREKDLYKKIREAINTPKKSEELVANLLDLSNVYKSLVNPGDEVYFSDTDLNQTLYNLKTVKASSFYPIILAMKNMDYSEEDIKEVAKAIETLIVRNCVIAGKVANKYEVIFADIAYKIFEKEYISSEEITEVLKKNTIKDDEFKSAFSMLTVKSKPVIRYVLRSINRLLTDEVDIIDDNKKIHIEHIMPVSNSVWKVDEEIHNDYLWRIGNLTLLGCEYNKTNSNKLFDEKKEMYQKSYISITKELVNYDQWTKNEIEKRQNKLADLALKAWSL